MCGIAGVARHDYGGVPIERLQQMAGAIVHRGPDGYGFFADGRVGLAHVRLAIIDLEGGAQPITNEDGRVIVVFNGEIYNFADLRDELVARGHRFRSASDTEVLVHAWESWGSKMTSRLIGQFAFALYDQNSSTVFLARDRFGVRPLFFAQRGGALWFCSEAKGLFASGFVDPVPDPRGLDQVFTMWGARPPRSVFADVQQLEPGCHALWEDGELTVNRYYDFTFEPAPEESHDALVRLDELFTESVRIRMRADVRVGAFLSGGLDSALTCGIASRFTAEPLHTFSITFDDPQLDERVHQESVVTALGTQHRRLRIRHADIADALPDAIKHLETPIVRTAPVPMYLLAKLTKESGVSVVLSGEGADELFLGYDIFKEAAIRRFILRRPSSRGRVMLLDRLYPYLRQPRAGSFWRDFFLSCGEPSDPLFSHLTRFRLGGWIRDFYSMEMRLATIGDTELDELRASLPPAFFTWETEHQAAYLEIVTLLSPYLLSSQSDRMGMAWAVEGRFPFLDHRVFEFAARLPVRSKLCGLREKEILRRMARRFLPTSIVERHKQPYRAPDASAFFGASIPKYVLDSLAPRAIEDAGFFRNAAVAGLVQRARSGHALGVRESQVAMAILTTQLWFEHFFRSESRAAPLSLSGADVLLGDALPAALTHSLVAL